MERVSKRLRGQLVLDGVNMTVPDSAIVVVLGPSGAGKTVLLKIIAGLIPPDSGQVLYDGTPLRYGRVVDNEPILKRIGFVFQTGALFDWLNVAENVALPLTEKTHLSKNEIKERVAQSLNDVGMTGAAKLKVRELSGGMVKLVAIARALVNDPSYLFFDEPTSGLDPANRERVCQLITEVSKKGKRSVVVVTHDLESARRLAERFYLLKGNQLVLAVDVKKEDYEPACP
ncbi:MAG: ATP-binding cassette domain-containing protein [candidate division WOR-3 bacterium]